MNTKHFNSIYLERVCCCVCACDVGRVWLGGALCGGGLLVYDGLFRPVQLYASVSPPAEVNAA